MPLTRKALVLGACASLLGQHLVELLLDSGLYTVTCLAPGNADALPWMFDVKEYIRRGSLTFLTIDPNSLLNPELMDQYLAIQGPPMFHVVFHCVPSFSQELMTAAATATATSPGAAVAYFGVRNRSKGKEKDKEGSTAAESRSVAADFMLTDALPATMISKILYWVMYHEDSCVSHVSTLVRNASQALSVPDAVGLDKADPSYEKFKTARAYNETITCFQVQKKLAQANFGAAAPVATGTGTAAPVATGTGTAYINVSTSTFTGQVTKNQLSTNITTGNYIRKKFANIFGFSNLSTRALAEAMYINDIKVSNTSGMSTTKLFATSEGILLMEKADVHALIDQKEAILHKC